MSTSTQEWDADAYDRLSDPQFRWGTKVLARVPLRGDETAIDAGCGTGRLTTLLLERLPLGRVIAIDQSRNMVDVASRRLLAAFGPDRVTVGCADLAALALDGVADLVLSTATLHWICDHDRLFRALFRALRPGGRLIAQAGGRGNLAALLERADAAVDALRLRPFFDAWPSPWLFADDRATAERLSAAGFVDVRTDLEHAPTPFTDAGTFRDFISRVVFRAHLERLPTPSQRDAFIDAVVDASSRADPSLHLDYVRLNIAAAKPV